jgi:carboxyl-terminal processing protease
VQVKLYCRDKKIDNSIKRNVVVNSWMPILAAVVLLVGLSNTLTGCSTGTPMARVFGGYSSSFSSNKDNSSHYQKFKKIYFALAADDGSKRLQLRHFSDAYDRVIEDYVSGINDEKLFKSAIMGIQAVNGVPGSIPSVKLIEAALDSMVSSLDPHSTYMNPQEFRNSQVMTSGQFGGLGVKIKMTNGLIEIISPMVDTPAYRAGLKSGDLITHVEELSIKEMSLNSAIQRLRGQPGSLVRITIRREGVGDFPVTLTRAIIKVQPVKWHIEGNIGVIHITHFNSRSLDALEKAMQSIHKSLGVGLKGVVVDLRNNPGGLLSQAVGVTDAFLDQGKIVTIRDRDDEVRSFNAQKGDISDGLPIVVLINRGSASASEIVAGALQDHRRATLMGMRSFGKGSVQTIIPLDWDGALRLTTALYYLPSGRTIQSSGVDPDFNVIGKKTGNEKREADLPNSLKTTGQVGQLLVDRQLNIDNCAAAGNDNKDKLLGCAVMYLNLNPQENFILHLANRKRK